MSGWRVARSLLVLIGQVNAIAPNRSKASDGTIGDAAHQGTTSDHNPDAYGVVRAADITHDPGDGADMAAISEQLRLSRDRRIKYVIFNRRIFSATNTPWTWRPYSGANPHDKHMHVSVVATGAADDESLWEIGDDMTEADFRTWFARALIFAAFPEKAPDAAARQLGQQTRDAIRAIVAPEGTSAEELSAALDARPVADVDEEALAAQLAPLLQPGVTLEQLLAVFNSARLTTGAG